MPKLQLHWLLPDAPFACYDEYLEATGANAVSIARAKAPAAVVRIVQHAPHRGRGGAGFPAGVKWASLAAHPEPQKYVVCNAAEGEPGTFKDRHLLRLNPYPVIEGLLIAAHAIGTRSIFIAIK